MSQGISEAAPLRCRETPTGPNATPHSCLPDPVPNSCLHSPGESSALEAGHLPDPRRKTAPPRLEGSMLQSDRETDIKPTAPRKSSGVQGMCDGILRVHVCSGICTLAKQITEGCLTCRTINRPQGGRSPGLRPFQSVQVDATELPRVGHV
jgi:hypothetical protein